MCKCGTLAFFSQNFGISHFGHFQMFHTNKRTSSSDDVPSKGIKVKPLWTKSGPNLMREKRVKDHGPNFEVGSDFFSTKVETTPTSPCYSYNSGVQNNT